MEANIIIWTQAYNAEKTIRRAVDSILNQTYGHFTYYLVDHASTDATGDIIREYAQKDSRIIPLYRKINSMDILHEYWPRLISHGEEGYLVWLDADDEYSLDFLAVMLRFAIENDLEMAMCGTEYVEQDGSSRVDTPSNTLILKGMGFAEYFPSYYKYTTRFWAILHSLRALSKVIKEEGKIDKREVQASFDDGLIMLKEMQYVKRAGLLAQSLHKYYMSPGQLSKQYTPQWFWRINNMLEKSREFLSYYGTVSRTNEDFIWIRFLIMLKYILPRIQGADVSLEVKLKDLSDIFTDRKTKALLAMEWKKMGIYSDKDAFLREVWEWIFAQKPRMEQLLPVQNFVRMLQMQPEEA